MGNQMISSSISVPILQSHMPAESMDAGPEPVFWIYIDDKCRWSLHKEGGTAQASFSSRAEAAKFVQDLAGNLSYRLFIEMPDGKIVQELHSATPSSANVHEAANDIAGIGSFTPAAAKDDRHTTERTDLRSRLEWAHRLEATSRVSPSRVSLLVNWLRDLRIRRA